MLKTLIALIDKSGKNVVPNIEKALKQAQEENQACFGMATPSTAANATDIKGLATAKLNSAIALGYVSTPEANKEIAILNTGEETLLFDGRIFRPAPKPSATSVLNRKLGADAFKSAQAILKTVEGEYALIIATPKRLVAARDPVGIQPLYYGESTQFTTFASNRTALWRLGVEEPKSFPPGHVAEATVNGIKITPAKTLEFNEPKPIGMAKAAATLQKLLEKSVRRRVIGQKEVAVAFSGGLDSSVVACLAKKAGVAVRLIHVSMRDQPETDEARKAALALGLPMEVRLFTEADAERDLPKVAALIEESDPVKAAVGLPFYWTAQQAATAGLQVMLAGQGADELFGGYQRYVQEYITKGDIAVRRTMFHDVAVIHESNLERDEKICSYFDVQLRIPFGSVDVATFAMSLPTRLKFECKPDSLRKLVLRRAAFDIEISKSIAEKPKKAVQYSTGVNNALKKIAKRHNQTLAEYVNQLFLNTTNTPRS